jgi:hypothetical protein
MAVSSLGGWRSISANATDKAVRGALRPNLSDGMYRVMQRGACRRIWEQSGALGPDPRTASEASSRDSLLHTRVRVERGWMAVVEILDRQGQQDLAWHVRRFTETLPPVRTDRELFPCARFPCRVKVLPQIVQLRPGAADPLKCANALANVHPAGDRRTSVAWVSPFSAVGAQDAPYRRPFVRLAPLVDDISPWMGRLSCIH